MKLFLVTLASDALFLRSSFEFLLVDEKKKAEYEMRIATDHAETETGNAD